MLYSAQLLRQTAGTLCNFYEYGILSPSRLPAITVLLASYLYANMCSFGKFQRLKSEEPGNLEQIPADEEDEDDNFGLDIKMSELLKEELNGADEMDKVRVGSISF